tara:strand:+ start:385 stop:1080 length:696 start_codon:yes stop_codon:yes gene_type:complete
MGKKLNLYGRNSGKGDKVHWSGLFNVDSSSETGKDRYFQTDKEINQTTEEENDDEEVVADNKDEKRTPIRFNPNIDLSGIGEFFSNLEANISSPSHSSYTDKFVNPNAMPSNIQFDLGYNPAEKGMKVPTYANGGLYANINKRKEAGTSRSKKDSTISDESYKNMQKGFPKAEKGMKLNKKDNGLTDRQMETLEKHKEHHSEEHMNMMIKLMKQGKTFTEAHNIAMKKVGK